MKPKRRKRAKREPGKRRSSLRDIGGVVVLALLLGAAVPWWLGTRIEPAFENSIAAAAANAGLDVRDVSYRRGWLSSTAAETLAIRGAPLTIEAQYRIEHGPVAVNGDDWRAGLVVAVVHATYRLRGAAGAPAGLAKLLASIPVARMDVRAGLDNSAVGTFTLPAGKLVDAKATITWATMTADLQFVPDWSRVTTSARIPSIAIAGPDAALQVRGVRLNSNLHRGPAETMLGDSSFEVDSVSLPGMFALSTLHAATHSRIADKLLNVDMDWGLRDSTVAGIAYGPADVKTSVHRLDPLALMRFSHDIDALYKRSLPPEQMQMILFGKALVLAGNLSKRNPEFEVSELRLKTQYGALSGRAKFSVQGASQDITANPIGCW